MPDGKDANTFVSTPCERSAFAKKLFQLKPSRAKLSINGVRLRGVTHLLPENEADKLSLIMRTTLGFILESFMKYSPNTLAYCSSWMSGYAKSLKLNSG